MKLNTLLAIAVLASTSLSSCVFNTAKERQLKYTHTTLLDGDAYAFFRQVGSIAPYELSYAEHVSKVGNAQAKDAAAKITSFFNEILPEMEVLATKNQMDFPILGTQLYEAAPQTEIEAPSLESDSLDTAPVTAPTEEAPAYSDEEYLAHVPEQIGIVKEQFRRLSRNTNREVRDFAVSKNDAVAELYVAVGGQADAHAHH